MSKRFIDISQRCYGTLLKLYPRHHRQEFGTEMQYVFTQSLMDASREKGVHGIIHIWTRTIVDTGKTAIIEQIKDHKGASNMAKKSQDIIKQNKVFAWIAGATLLLLMIPLVAMQYDTGVDWGPLDFTLMAILIFGCASGFVLVARRVSKSRRLLVALIFGALFMYAWAELAVGVFTNLGS